MSNIEGYGEAIKTLEDAAEKFENEGDLKMSVLLLHIASIAALTKSDKFTISALSRHTLGVLISEASRNEGIIDLDKCLDDLQKRLVHIEKLIRDTEKNII
jgi:plasmid replication initiation protein